MVYCSKCGAELQESAVYCSKCGSLVGSSIGSTPSPVTGRLPFDQVLNDGRMQEHWVRRIVAYIIDVVIIIVIVGILGIFGTLLSLPFLPGLFSGGFPPFLGVWFGGLSSLILLAYFIIAEATYSGTIGKEIVGLRVERTDGRPMDLSSSLIRNISKISFLLLLLDIAAGLFTRGDPGQKFSDRYARTRVVTRTRPVTV